MMLSCEEITLLLSQKLDEELNQAENDQVEEHLATCPDCCAFFQAISSIHGDMSLLSHEPPAGLGEKIMNRIREDASLPAAPATLPFTSDAKKMTKGWNKWIYSAAVLGVVMLSTMGLWTGGHGGVDEATMDTVWAATAAPEAAEEAADSVYSTSKAHTDVSNSDLTTDVGSDSEGGDAGSDMNYTTATESENITNRHDLYIASNGEVMSGDGIPDGAALDTVAALAALQEYLVLDSADTLSYVGLSAEGLHYMFHHCPDEATVNIYLVSILDGSVSLPVS